MIHQSIDIELTRPGLQPRVFAAAGDIYTRVVDLHLYAAGEPYSPPEGTTCVIGWRRGGTVGSYDKILDSEGEEHAAWQIDGNVLSVELDWHITDIPGLVELNVGLLDSAGGRLSTWDMLCEVRTGAAKDADNPELPNESATQAADRAEQAAEAAAGTLDEMNQILAQAAKDAAAEATKAAAASAEAAASSVTEASVAVQQAEAAAARAESAMDDLEQMVKDGPVMSVNGQTGVVKLKAADLPFDNSGTKLNSDTVQAAITELLDTAGIPPQIIVTAPAGSEVIVTTNEETYTADEQSGQWLFVLNKYGTYTVTATKDGQTATDTVEVNTVQQYRITLAYFEATIQVTVEQGAAVTATLSSDSVSASSGSDGFATLIVTRPGNYTVQATKNDAPSNTQSVQVSESGVQYSTTLTFCTLSVTAPAGSTLTVAKDSTTLTDTASGSALKFYLPSTGSWTVTATLGGETAAETVNAAGYQNYELELSYRHIYGVQWDGTSTTKWTRTDEAAGFVDPVPYVSGSSSYSSPFDTLQPWAGMVTSERTGGTMVAIPKFWYKLTKSGSQIKVQIADKDTEGFSVSPAHMDRGDGKGERDIVYIGRYHCHTSNWKSQTGGKPKADITRSSARSSIHSLGANIWQMDFAMRFTVWLLYLVEFADWNSQSAIGYGCGNDSATQNMGYTDSMPYHTGTTLSSRTTYGLGTQYRNIEGLWDNVRDWIDGCYYNSSGLNIILNPSSFSDSSGGTNAGSLVSGYPSAFNVSSSGGYQVFLPSASNGSESTYTCDNWYYDSSYPCLYGGGSYDQYQDYGLFYVSYGSASDSYADLGCRLQELP